MKTAHSLRSLAVASVAAALGAASSHDAFAFTSAPAFKIGTAALVSNAAADTYFAGVTPPPNSSPAIARSNDVIELARALGNNVDAIYAYVRNNVEISWTYGLQKGALGALIDKRGTSFDQAHLMVELLRQAGYSSASYVAGRMTLTGAQWSAWSGLTSAKATCQLLASGGIPGSVNGSSSATCDYTGSVSSVVLAHIWVKVNIGGTDYVFDPSYKPHAFTTGIDLAATAGLSTAGELLTQAVSGMTSGTASGVGYVKNLNAESVATRIQTYADNLYNYIQTNKPAGKLVDIVGGSVITPAEIPVGGLRQQSLPFTTSSPTTWSGNIPNQYRTTLRVQIAKWTPSASTIPVLIDKLLYADETYGRKLVFMTNFQSSGFLGELKLVDRFGVGPVLGSYSGSENPNYSIGGEITLTVNHPYPGSSDGTGSNDGSYMDVVVRKLNLRYWTPLTIVQGWGDADRGLIDTWGARRESVLEPTPSGCGDSICESAFVASAGDAKREQTAASWLVQFSQSARLHAAIGNSVFVHHHTVGVVAGDSYLQTSVIGAPPNNFTQSSISDSFDRVDLETGFSVTSKSADALSRRAAVHAIASTGEALEGSAVGQVADLPDTASTAARFDWANRPPGAEDLSGGYGPRRFYSFSSANSNQALGLAVVEGMSTTANDGVHLGTTEPELGGSEVIERRTALANAIDLYAQAGFSVTAAEDAFLGPGQRGGAYFRQAGNNYMHVLSRQRSGAFVATRYSGSDPVEIAHVLVAQDVNIKGGGGGVQPSQDAQYDPSKAADILKSRFVDRSDALGVDLRSGMLTHVSPASLSVGNGGFPYELSAQLIWRGGDEPDDRFGPNLHTAPQSPWTTNWHNALSLSSSALEVLYDGDVRATAGTIAAFLAAQDTYKQAVSSQREVAAVLVNAWWLRQIQNNTATVSVGNSTRQFVRRRWDGSQATWIEPGAGAVGTLLQTGARSPFVEAKCDPGGGGVTYVTSRGWNDAGMSFKLVNANGDEQNFERWRSLYREGGVGTLCAIQHGFRLANWVFPYGVTVNVAYVNDLNGIPQLSEVNNNLGRKIVFTDGGLSGFNNGLTGEDLRTVSATQVLVSAEPPHVTYRATHTDPDGKVTRYQIGHINRQYTIEKIFTADNLNVPATEYVYDSLLRVKEAKDAVAARLGTRSAYQFFIAEGVSGDRLDPAGGQYSVFYNSKKQPIGYADELDRRTWLEVDGRGRPTRYIYPESDEELLEYDDRNNVKKLTQKGKPCTPQPSCTPPVPLVIEAYWNTTWNKPDWIIDARLNRTDFAYYPSGNGRSLLYTATRPAPDGSTPRPVYTFTYNGMGKVVDATDPTGVVQHNENNAVNGNLASTTLDPTGINTTTSYEYDPIGNVKWQTDPRGNVTEFGYDNVRRRTLTKHHNGGVGAPCWQQGAPTTMTSEECGAKRPERRSAVRSSPVGSSSKS